MNKTQLVEAVAAKANLTQKDTKAVLDAFYATVAEQAAKSEPIVITGFGSFSVSERAAKEGRNPATGAKITIPAKVTKLGKSAFEGCKKLKTLKITSKKLTSKNATFLVSAPASYLASFENAKSLLCISLNIS